MPWNTRQYPQETPAGRDQLAIWKKESHQLTFMLFIPDSLPAFAT
jgi:hypothetical protein